MNKKDKKALEAFEKEFDEYMEELKRGLAKLSEEWREEKKAKGLDKDNKEELQKAASEAYRRAEQKRTAPLYPDLGAWGRCQDAWRPDDKAWLAERKKEWRLVAKNLDRLHDQTNRLPKRLRKPHKELFFYGTIHEERGGEASPFGYCQLFFLMWYYPEPSEAVFREFCGAPPATTHQLKDAREMLLNYSYLSNGPYGFLGGREELLAKVLIPPLDCTEELVFQPNGGVLEGLAPKKIFSECVYSSHGLLASRPPEKRFSPYLVGQYLWDQMDYAFEHYYHRMSYIDGYGLNEFLFADLDREMPGEIYYLFDLLRLILDFDEREGAPKDNPAAVALRERLLARFEARDFNPRLMAVWDEVKAHYESGDEEPLWGLF